MIDTTNLWDGLFIMGIWALGLLCGKFLWNFPDIESEGSDISKESESVCDKNDTSNTNK